MGNKQSTPPNFKLMKKNYLEGVNNKKNFNIDQIYVTLLMKLNYYQTKCKLSKIPLIYETTAYSNSIEKQELIIPMTIDFISGMIIVNKNKKPCKINIIWNSKTKGIKDTILETIHVKEGERKELNLHNLYMFMATYGEWKIIVDMDNVNIKYKCGIIDSRASSHYRNNKFVFTNILGEKFEYVSGSLID
jgi:hypothetical protein